MKPTKFQKIQISQEMIDKNPQIRNKYLDSNMLFKVNISRLSRQHIDIHLPDDNIVSIHNDYVDGTYAKYVDFRDIIKIYFKHHFKNK